MTWDVDLGPADELGTQNNKCPGPWGVRGVVAAGVSAKWS